MAAGARSLSRNIQLSPEIGIWKSLEVNRGGGPPGFLMGSREEPTAVFLVFFPPSFFFDFFLGSGGALVF